MVLRKTQPQSSAEKYFSAKLSPEREEADIIVKMLSPTVYELKYSPGRIPKVYAVDLIRLKTSSPNPTSKQNESENSQNNSSSRNEQCKGILEGRSPNQQYQMAEAANPTGRRRRGRPKKRARSSSSTGYTDENGRRYNLRPRRP